MRQLSFILLKATMKSWALLKHEQEYPYHDKEWPKFSLISEQYKAEDIPRQTWHLQCPYEIHKRWNEKYFNNITSVLKQAIIKVEIYEQQRGY